MQRGLARTLVAVSAALVGVIALATPGDAQRLREASLSQLAGQRIIFGFDGTRPPRALLDRIHRRQAAGVIIYKRNISSRDQLRALNQAFQNARPRNDPPLLIMIDQEGGTVKRLGGAPDHSPAELGRINDYHLARKEGRATARNLRDVWVNVNLAPVVDVARRGSVMERLGRSYSESKKIVTRMGGAFARGLEERGVSATAKHFPGLGAAQLDEDQSINRISYSKSQLRRTDEAPYKSLAKQDVDLVMVSTAEYPAFASRPALFAHKIATRELRRYVKFHGVSISDDLETPAAAHFGSPGARAVKTARAGVDLLLFAQTISGGSQAADALVDAVNRGELGRDDLRRSVDRITRLRNSLR